MGETHPSPSSAAGPARRPRLELLGLPALIGAAGTRIALERKAAALLALLAVDGSRTRADLCLLLWPQATPAQARNSLRQRLFRLQRAAGAEIVVGNEDLRLADTLEHDLTDPGERLSADPDARVGTLLEGLTYDDTIALAEWLEAARESLRRRCSARLAELASQHEAAHRVARALAYAQRLCDDEPLLEHARRRLMRLHYLRGDRSAALGVYEAFARRLALELGAVPDRETRDLAALIASSNDGPSRSAPVRAAAPPVSVLRPPRLCGRAAERDAITGVIGARATLVLHGEPGIGKTRLLEDAAESAPGLLLTGARAGDRRVPYALLARLVQAMHTRASEPLVDWARAELARLVPALGPAPAARLDPLRLQQAWASALATWAGTGLVGVLVDDLHHADEASLECLLGQAGAAPIAWVFGVRTQEMPEALTQWLADASPAAVQRLALAQLDHAGIDALLASLDLPHFEAGRWGAALTRHSGGNPLFALETVRALLALGPAAPSSPEAAPLPVPAALGAMIERRLAQLSARALKLLRVAALAGADFDADLAAQVLEAHPLDMVEPWRELEQAQLLCDGWPAHDLIAEAAGRTLPASIAQALHARLAGALEMLGRAAARVAPHWAAAQSWARAGDAYAAAAREARRASRRSDEAGLWEAAAQAHDSAGQLGKAFDARADSIECVIILHGVGAAMRLVERLDADQRTEPQRMRALLARATVHLMAGDAKAGEAAARAAFDAATRLGAQWPRFEAARLLAVALAQAARADEALCTIEPFRDFVTTHGDAEQRHHFWADYAYALKAAQRGRETAEALRQAMCSAQESGDYAELATLTSNLALVEGNLGRFQSALDHGRRARALGDPLGDTLGPASGAIEMYIAMYAATLGRYGESLASFARAEACFGSDARTVWTGLAANHKAGVLIHLGQYARARQVLEHDGPMMPATLARRELLHARIDRALAHRSERSVDAAIAMLGEHVDRLMQMLLRLEGTLELGPADGAAACSELFDEASACEHLAIAMRARVLRLDHRLAARDLDTDEVDACAAALRLTHPADTYLPAAWWTVVRAYRALGLDAEGDAVLRETWGWIVEDALPHVPEAYRDSFLNRNPTNREVLATAAHRLALRLPSASITAR